MKLNTNNLSIKQWSEDDRPREKLLKNGINTLSDAELIAILIGSGNREESAVGLSKRILASVNNNLNELSKLTEFDLMKFKGIGEAKSISISTALELGKRSRLEHAVKKNKINCSNDVYEFMVKLIGTLNYEEFWVLFLNNSNKIISKYKLSKGGITGTLVDVRLVLKKALELLATGIILCHNHPSGSLKPSTADKKLTDKMKNATQIVDIKLLDHLIITEKAYFSFADEGIL